MSSPAEKFSIRGWQRLLYAIIFAWLCVELCRFWGNWQEGVTSVFYVIHAPLHEVGHTVAAMLHCPEMLVILAGTIFQLLTPCLIGLYLCLHNECQAVALCLGWLGCSTIEVAAYMNDAPCMNLNLVTPFAAATQDGHDWHNLFSMWNCLEQAETIAGITAFLGYTLLFASLAAIAFMFFLGFRQNKE